ncbi:16S rRNA (cytidine(1402)-2'-O)-methyltransferase [Dehalococcoidia bacterium]|nr:16S rRNA (cytidine(1402)-2'-O)-methyltransferase [Dehalococcoidia bacterium]
MSTLYVVATPIGNLEDVTLRAIRVLHEVGLIAAEDTRRTKRLLSAHQIKTPLTSYHEHNKRAKLPYLLRALEHGDVALISEAGMPGINDPGYDLVLAAVDRDAKVVPVPGPSAIPAALAVSGLTTEQFIHLGFLPRKKGARRKLLQSIAAEPRTIVAFETPHRLRSALVDLGEVLGERRLAICREMTKLHEEIFRGTVSQAIEHFAKPRGEFTLVIEGKAREPRCADRPRLDEFERGKYNRD